MQHDHTNFIFSLFLKSSKISDFLSTSYNILLAKRIKILSQLKKEQLCNAIYKCIYRFNLTISYLATVKSSIYLKQFVILENKI